MAVQEICTRSKGIGQAGLFLQSGKEICQGMWSGKSRVVQRKEKEIRIVFFQHKNLESSDEAIRGDLKGLRKAVSTDLL